MKKFNKYLYDHLNREYERKNRYLYDVASLKEHIEETQGEEKEVLKNKLKELIKNKSEHPYNKELSQFKSKEKEFLAQVKGKLNTSNDKVNRDLPSSAQKLQIRLVKAQEYKSFYEKYIDLSYDAQMLYEQSKIEIEQIPPIISFAKESKEDLDSDLKKKGEIKSEEVSKFKNQFENYKKEQKIILSDSLKKVKEKFNEGSISAKAKENSMKQLKKQYKDNLIVKSLESEKDCNNEIIKNKRYELKTALKQKINALNINVDDIRRTCPVETEKTHAWVSYALCLIPGAGQLANKQYIKSIIMFLATIYIYFIAVPYSLGFGNYKGDGIAGLITLAEGGARLDRSIIFMIEGILAIALLAIGATLLWLSFKDANKVEKDIIKGVRVKSWCETRQSFFEDGFPYIVSMPALIVIIFIVFIPIATTVLLSFTGMDPNSQAKFGWEALANYKMIVLGQGMAGAVFWKILGWTIVWTLGATTLALVLGFGLALILNNERIKGKRLFRSIYLLPWAVPSFITIIFFSILCAPNGTITEMAKNSFGLSVAIKNDPFLARLTLILIQGWLGSAYVFLLCTGVLQSINNDLYEAADIDGASGWKKLTKITIPMVLVQTAPLLVGQYTFNFNNFSIIYLFNSGGPFNPVEYGNLAGSTDLLISYVYKLTMQNQYQALGAAITVIISLGLMVFAYIGFRNTSAFKKEK